jgi:hypothetical protein
MKYHYPNHLIISRCRFPDKELMAKYITMAKEFFVPSIKAQSNKNFKVMLMAFKEDEQHLREQLGIDFTVIEDNTQLLWYVRENAINIQTRHDIDDWMGEGYVDEIQKIYLENDDRYDKFLIQAHPVMVEYHKKEEKTMPHYTDTRTSMFLSLCQKKPINHIFEKKHGDMWKIAPDVFSVPDGLVKWVIHGDNISCRRPSNWEFSSEEER